MASSQACWDFVLAPWLPGSSLRVPSGSAPSKPPSLGTLQFLSAVAGTTVSNSFIAVPGLSLSTSNSPRTIFSQPSRPFGRVFGDARRQPKSLRCRFQPCTFGASTDKFKLFSEGGGLWPPRSHSSRQPLSRPLGCAMAKGCSDLVNGLDCRWQSSQEAPTKPQILDFFSGAHS